MKQSTDDAIARHLDWVRVFRDAIAAGTVSEPIEHCAYDDLCAFGKWLYSLDDAVKLTPAYRRVKDLHYRFHLEASLVANEMRAGRFEQARQMAEGEFAATSRLLIDAIREWQIAGAS